MPSAVITRKGQVTIPKIIRQKVELEIGDRVSFVVRGSEVVLKAQRGSVLDFEGSVKPRRRPDDFGEVRRAVLSKRAERAAADG